MVLVSVAAACAPELLPIPVTQRSTAAPSTPTSVAVRGPLAAPNGIVLLRMLDAANGWAITANSVVRTADGGATWHDVGPSAPETYGYRVTSAFLDIDHAWVLVPDPNDMEKGILYRSSDGGDTWSESPVPFGSGTLRFLDSKRGWMMADLGAGAGSMAIAVFRSEDSGATWTQTFTNNPTRPGASKTLPLGGLKDGMTVKDSLTAWIGGVTYAPGTVYLYQTSDGGSTWTKSPVTVSAGYEEAELETPGPIFVNADVGYLPVHLSTQNGTMLAIYVSRDAGSSWLLTPSLIAQGRAADFVSPDTGFVWNGAGFYVTNDAAQTWKVVAPDVDFGDTFGGMDFVDPQVGFVLRTDSAGNSSLYKTLDGGATWTLLGN
jgi:photosystem II stability/assembly factor-like uncharacterized protein